MRPFYMKQLDSGTEIIVLDIFVEKNLDRGSTAKFFVAYADGTMEKFSELDIRRQFKFERFM